MNAAGTGLIRRRVSMVVAMAVGVLLAVGVAVGLALAASVTIDTFDEGSMYLQARPNAGTTDQGYVNTTAALGGQRDAYIYNESGGGGVSLAIDEGGTTNQAKFNQDSGVRGHGEIVWDGQDNDATTLDADGLGGVDLTDGGTNDGFQLLVYYCDGGFDLGMWVYSNTTTAYYTLTISSAIAEPGQAFFVKFADFSGSGSVFTSTGAVVFRIRPSADSVDLTLDLYEATAETDFGDLPDTYSTTLASNGPRHVKGSLWLGSLIDLEANGFPSTDATGDDNNNYDDEDGIQRVPGYQWQPGNTVAISATVTGGSGDLYAWFDWDNDGSFSDETAISWTGLSAGEHVLTLTVDSRYTPANQVLNARFRLVPAGATSPNYYGSVNNGEVEDYHWTFTPTAVVLHDLKAVVPGTGLPVVLLSVSLGLVGLGLLVVRKRRI